jgi:hypothetical protein
MLVRARICRQAGIGDCDMIPVEYGESKLAKRLRVPLRLCSGLSDREELERISLVFTRMMHHMSPFTASKSPFQLNRFIKQAA